MDNLCSSCGVLMDIDHVVYEMEGDESDKTETKLYTVPLYRCRNPACPRFGMISRGEPIPLPVQKAKG